MVRFLRSADGVGIDIDWEYPKGKFGVFRWLVVVLTLVDEAEAQNFVLLLQKCREVGLLHRLGGYVLTK